MLPGQFFTSTEVFERSVTLPDGSKHKLHFRQASAAAFRKFAIAEKSDDPDIRACSPAHLIAGTLCTPDGELVLTYEKACALTAPAMSVLFQEALTVGVSDTAGKPSKAGTKNGSGTSSRSRSVAARSRSGKAP